MDVTHISDTAAADHIADTSGAHAASAISVLDTANDFTATDVEGALAELQSDHEADATALSDHISDSSAAHAASAISIADSGNDFTATDVEGALAELQSDHEADETALSDHLSDTTDAHDASAISFAPTGTIAATDVQAAIAEVASEAGGAWTTIIKPSDTPRTNNTVSADPDLQVTLSANTNYLIRLKVSMTTNATADSRYALTFAGTTTRVRRNIVRTATSDVPAFITAGTAFDVAGSPIVLSTTGTNPYVDEDILLQVGASGGLLAFQWAQVTTNGSPCTVLEGSTLEYAVT